MRMVAMSAVLLLASGYAMAQKGGEKLVGGGAMQHCPTAVPGAKVIVAETVDALEITVTHAKADQAAEIRKRAAHVVDAAKAEGTKVQHDGAGHGGGGLGQCVVVLKDTTITAADVEGGTKLTVKPTRPIDFEWLKKETKERQAAGMKGKKAK
jgi:hypothetical protein